MLQELLGSLPATRFFEEYFFRLPCSRAGDARGLVRGVDWPLVEAVLASSNPDLMLARDGRLRETPASLPFEQARILFREGFTLVVRSAEKHHPTLGALADAFRADFGAPVNIHLYCTPAGRHGFGWHYDAEDVFILQAQGVKRYFLRRNTVNPWPVLETMPRDMRFERETMPILDCRLAEGDWLYLPAGYWHRAEAESDSISLAVGLLSPTVLEVLDFLRRRAPESIIWRQRLPGAGAANPLSAEERLARTSALFAELGKDLARTLADPEFAREFLASRGA